MRKITLFSAMSLDGYVARPDGNIDWLTGFPNPAKLDIPVVLGSGIPMFDARTSLERTFTLTEPKPWYNGILELRYKFVHSITCNV